MPLGPKRIVCLTEETTELLYLLGEQDRIVGITAYTVRPVQAKLEKPVVTAFVSGHIEKIKALKPDLVIGFSDVQADFASQLIREGLNVLILNQRSIEEIFEAMMLIGSLVHRSESTAQIISNWKCTIAKVRGKQRSDFKPRVFFQEWDEPIITGIQWVSELIEIAGGTDCFSDLKDRGRAKNRIVEASEVAKRDPQLIIGSWCGKPMDKNWVCQKPEWKNSSAVLSNQIFEIDSSIILQPGPALFAAGLPALKKLIDEVPSVVKS